MDKDEALQMCLEYIETDAHERKYVRHAIKEALAQPAQEPTVVSKAKFNHLQDDYDDLLKRSLQDAKHAKEWRAHVTRCQYQGVDLDHVFNAPLPVQPAQEPVAWVGLTDEERESIAQDYSLIGFGYQSPFKAIEDKLKEKNT